MSKRDARAAARQLRAMARRRGEWTKADIHGCQICVTPVDGKMAWHVTSGGSTCSAAAQEAPADLVG
jgi:hypothetical protein